MGDLAIWRSLRFRRTTKETLIKYLAFPQRLKPHCGRWIYGGTKVPPLQNEDLIRGSLIVEFCELIADRDLSEAMQARSR